MLGLFALQTPAASPLDRMAQAVRSHRAVSGTLRYLAFGKPGEVRFRFLAPASVRLEGEIFGGTLLTDGREAWSVHPSSRTYRRLAPPNVYASAFAVVGYNALIRPPGLDYRSLLERAGPATFVGERWEGRDVIEAILGVGPVFMIRERFPTSLVLRIDPNSWLPLGMHSERAEDGISGETYRYEDIVLDPPLRPDEFRFVPPTGYRDEATLPRPTPPRPRLGDPYPRVLAKPGTWAEEGALALRAEARIRSYSGMWVFDLETRGPQLVDWTGLTVLVRSGENWRFGRVVARPDGRHAIVTVPIATSKERPDVLQILDNRKTGSARALVFDWRA